MMKRAFTLIELLIVVAIIAILAAIAVPNFLESQTRAKVSRAMADMRSIATAIEAYTVDYNKPVPDGLDWVRMTGNSPANRSYLLNPLTSPVAYMTSIPEDPFFKREEFPIRHGVPFYMTATGDGGYFDGIHNSPTDPAAFFYGPRSHFGWVINTRGPDMFLQYIVGTMTALPEYNGAGDVLYYDPTNGTKSPGDIYYYGPGGGFNPPPVTSR